MDNSQAVSVSADSSREWQCRLTDRLSPDSGSQSAHMALPWDKMLSLNVSLNTPKPYAELFSLLNQSGNVRLSLWRTRDRVQGVSSLRPPLPGSATDLLCHFNAPALSFPTRTTEIALVY